MNVEVCIPVHTTGHPFLVECAKNVRLTTGRDPVVWECPGNVSVNRNQALAGLSSEYVCFLDADAFPIEHGWLDLLVAAADQTRATIVSPVELLQFDNGVHSFPVPFKEVTVLPSTANCTTMCLLVRRADVQGFFDENCGLTAGRIGPCIEDTDFANAVQASGGTHAYHPGVHVLHRDRGAATYEDWQRTDEYTCYSVMSELVATKWLPEFAARRKDFFLHLGSVPASDQRHMAPGYGSKHLADCFLPVAADLPSPLSEKLASVIEQTVCARP
jgi:hypothetical protein